MVCKRDSCCHPLAHVWRERYAISNKLTELIEEWQLLLQGVQPVNAQTSEHEEVVRVERQRQNTAVSFVLRCDSS